MSTQVIKAGSKSEIAHAVREAARALKAGLLVGFPTETVYGIAAVATNAKTLRRLRKLKSRPSGPFSVILAAPKDVKQYVPRVPAAARRLIDGAWPGPVTLLLGTGGKLADHKLDQAGMHAVLCKDNTIGLRCPDNDIARAILAKAPPAVVAPSANLAGEPAPTTAEGVLDALDGQIDLLIDAGPCPHGKASTIVQFDSGRWNIVRQGALAERTVRKLVGAEIIFVCTGNTCRSPMAGGIAKKLLADRAGLEAGELRTKLNLKVSSAGIWAMDGHRAMPEALRAADMLGASISSHRSRKLTRELINSADLLLCMTVYHVEEVRRLAPVAADKIRRLDLKADIPDPIGGGDDIYRATAERIAKAIATCMDKGVL